MRVPGGSVAKIKCPKCSQVMDAWESRGVELDHCNSCKGLWFDQGELTRHFLNSGSRISERDLEADRETPLCCPRCEAGRLTGAHLASVPVDTCRRCHGIFLDLGEVHELMGAIARAESAGDPRTAGFDNFALGLYIGANLGAK